MKLGTVIQDEFPHDSMSGPVRPDIGISLFAIDDETLLPLGRPWFSACEDDYTRCILGMFVGFIPPSFLTVSLCLKDAFRPKTWLKQA